jgi:hypothetical protein
VFQNLKIGGLKMTIVKINLHKVNAERNLESKGGQIKISNNVSINNVEDLSFAVQGKKGLKFTFNFSCNYEPDLGKTEVEGQVVYVDDDKKVSEVMQSWNDGKKIPMDVMEQIINAALHKSNIQAIKISDDVSLPSPLPLPKVNREVPQDTKADVNKAAKKV